MKKLNILHLESSPGWGGQEIRILRESAGMRRLGHKVIIAVEKNGDLVSKARENGFLTYEIRFKKVFWLISFFKLIFLIKKHKIDIINTHSSCDSWLGGIVARLFKVKVIRTRHLSSSIRKGLNSRLLYGYLADFVVTTCKEIVDVIIKQSKKDPDQCKSIPTGVNFQKINASFVESQEFRKKYHFKNEDFLVGSVCFMRSWKGIDDFLKAAKLLEKEKDIKFVIIGGGHKEEYIKLAEKMKLRNVLFTDHLENPSSAILALDVFVLLSTAHEGVSQASLQAAYLQKPLITTPTGGLKEVCIDQITGFQVPIFSPERVAKAISNLKNSSSVREKFAQNARKLAFEFSEESMLYQMSEVYSIATKQ